MNYAPKMICKIACVASCCVVMASCSSRSKVAAGEPSAQPLPSPTLPSPTLTSPTSTSRFLKKKPELAVRAFFVSGKNDDPDSVFVYLDNAGQEEVRVHPWFDYSRRLDVIDSLDWTDRLTKDQFNSLYSGVGLRVSSPHSIGFPIRPDSGRLFHVVVEKLSTRTRQANQITRFDDIIDLEFRLLDEPEARQFTLRITPHGQLTTAGALICTTQPTTMPMD
jgi:hypothetical protein